MIVIKLKSDDSYSISRSISFDAFNSLFCFAGVFQRQLSYSPSLLIMSKCFLVLEHADLYEMVCWTFLHLLLISFCPEVPQIS